MSSSNADKSKANPSPTTNLLSSVPPPSELPTYILNQVPAEQKQPETSANVPFSAAIPSNLGENYHPEAVEARESSSQTPTSPNTSDFKKLSLNPEPVTAALAPLTQLATNSGNALFGWMKGAADASGGLLQKIGEKAMNSMDTLVTTLDPQMKDYIRSGGDVEILIASHKENKVRPIREAFQLVFGRATLMGMQMDEEQSRTAAQPVGFSAALKACQDRILQVRASNGVGNKLPVIAVENFLVEIYPEHWFDVGLIILDEPEQNIFLETFTQMTPIPSPVAVALAAQTPSDYNYADTGYSVTVGELMGANLNVAPTEWHQLYTGTRRSEFIYLAAKTLATLYKNAMEQQEKDILARHAALVDNPPAAAGQSASGQETK